MLATTDPAGQLLPLLTPTAAPFGHSKAAVVVVDVVVVVVVVEVVVFLGVFSSTPAKSPASN